MIYLSLQLEELIFFNPFSYYFDKTKSFFFFKCVCEWVLRLQQQGCALPDVRLGDVRVC